MKTNLAGRLTVVVIALGISSSVAAREDFRDVQYLFGVVLQRLETQRIGVEVPWSNPITGNSGVVVIDREDVGPDGLRCRDYRRITDVEGEAPIIHSGRGCRAANGRWNIQPEVAAVPPTVPSRPSTPVARVEPEPAEPPPMIPPPGRKPDPNVFFASVPTPSDYR